MTAPQTLPRTNFGMNFVSSSCYSLGVTRPELGVNFARLVALGEPLGAKLLAVLPLLRLALGPVAGSSLEVSRSRTAALPSSVMPLQCSRICTLTSSDLIF